MAYDGKFENDRILGEGILKNNTYTIHGMFNAQSQLDLNMEVKGLIEYENKDKFKGTMLLDHNIIKRYRGDYYFYNGDIAKG